ncbi:MAG: class I SAM-dependent methyltransferase [Gemmatimonadaceae bacterium]
MNYYRWLLRRFSPYVGAEVLEIGAGTGTFSRLLLTLPQVKRLIAIEPSDNNFPQLSRRLANQERATTVKGYLEGSAPPQSVDSLIAVNVLEHIERDDDILRQAWEIARQDATLLLFVPAVPAIFGSLDTAFEHFRRYTKESLRNSVETAGWSIERLGYMNIPGILPWFVSGRVLRRTSISGAEARLYDSLVVPVTAAIEDRVSMPIGQSLLAIARKNVT